MIATLAIIAAATALVLGVLGVVSSGVWLIPIVLLVRFSMTHRTASALRRAHQPTSIDLIRPEPSYQRTEAHQ